MIIKNTCPNCGGNVEFDAEHIGTETDCPHCAKAFRLYGSAKASPGAFLPKRQRRNITGILLTAALVAIAALVGFYGDAALKTLEVIGISGMAIAYLAGFVLVIFLIILWILFPFLVVRGLRRQEELLKKIEINTRR